MKRKYIWLIEILFWILIISGGLFFFVYQTAIKANSQNTYYFFFNDVDGLVSGSPVRLMGINIGYVRNIKIFDNKVFISFLVTKENVVIPKNATATIEFYGLGGSTSLELNPSTSNDSSESSQIVPAESYRVQDFWDGQKLVANTLINIYGSIGRNVKKEDVPVLQNFAKQSSFIKEISKQTASASSMEEVVISKLTKDVNPYLQKKSTENSTEKQNNLKEKGEVCNE